MCISTPAHCIFGAPSETAPKPWDMLITWQYLHGHGFVPIWFFSCKLFLFFGDCVLDIHTLFKTHVTYSSVTWPHNGLPSICNQYAGKYAEKDQRKVLVLFCTFTFFLITLIKVIEKKATESISIPCKLNHPGWKCNRLSIPPNR